MQFTTYWRSTPAKRKEEIASACKTSVGFLNNIAGGFRKSSPELAAAIERSTLGAVTRRALRPTDWGDIWPELIDAEHPWTPVADEAQGAA